MLHNKLVAKLREKDALLDDYEKRSLVSADGQE